MAMNVGTGGTRDPDVMIDINTTPLIDVMLVLLVMLIITIPIQLHSVNLNMPTGNPPPPLKQPESSNRHRLRRHDLLERRGRARSCDARSEDGRSRGEGRSARDPPAAGQAGQVRPGCRW